MDVNDSAIKKALITFSIERSLLDLGEPVLQKVADTLKADYNCYVPDCYDHPEYLKRVLSDLYGSASLTIIDSIRENLKEFSHQAPIQRFLVALG